MKPGPKKTWVLSADSSKACIQCKEVKPVDQFSPQARGVFGVSAQCKTCRSAAKRLRYSANIDECLKTAAAYRAANPDKVRKFKAAAMAKKPEYYLAKSSAWKKNNPERVNANERARRARRSDELKPLNRAKQKRFYEKRKLDGGYRLGRSFSTAINAALRGRKAGRVWRSLVSYSVDDLKRHIERQFLAGMSWANYGHGWHVDHIIPKSAFTFETADCDEFKACWALSNLRPLWKPDNMVKQARRTLLL
jgi:hypothetical protein